MIGFVEQEPIRPRIVESKAKCPKCKSNTLSLNEIWKDHTITWEQEDGVFNRDEGYLEPGEAYKVQARCRDCEHVWTVKGALQIDDIVK